jgi:flagellar basal body rod protein FlgC
MGTMTGVSPIAISGLVAASVRMQDSAGRIANLSVAAPESETAGTRATGNAASPGSGSAFQPDARFSASYGLLSGPNVNLAGEIIEQLTASTTFMAVAQVIRADSKMIEALLDIKV